MAGTEKLTTRGKPNFLPDCLLMIWDFLNIVNEAQKYIGI